jgi:hypothetical protein
MMGLQELARKLSLIATQLLSNQQRCSSTCTLTLERVPLSIVVRSL